MSETKTSKRLSSSPNNRERNMKTNGNDPAYPVLDVGVTVPNGSNPQEYIAFAVDGGDFNANYPGFTKREMFAVLVMQGLIAGRVVVESGEKAATAINIARMAVSGADALLAVLNGE